VVVRREVREMIAAAGRRLGVGKCVDASVTLTAPILATWRLNLGRIGVCR
jgi:hypothetical protein